MRRFAPLLLLCTATTWYVDADADGFGDPATADACGDTSPGCVDLGDDCDDADAMVHPLVTATLIAEHAHLADRDEEASEADRAASYVADGIDQDCDGVDVCYRDDDDDHFGPMPEDGAPPDVVLDDDLTCGDGHGAGASEVGDCDDADADRSPEGVEACNGVDDDCDGELDETGDGERATWFVDADGDGHGDGTRSVEACGTPSGFAQSADDCDDEDSHVSPDAVEFCDGDDDDCNGEIDEDTAIDTVKWYQDADGDGYGDCRVSRASCWEPTSDGPWMKSGSECDPDDTDATIGAFSECWCGCCDQPSIPGMATVAPALAALVLRRRRAG